MSLTQTQTIILLAIVAISVIVLSATHDKRRQKQLGGDPYEWIRPWIIVDIMRKFWLTR